MSEQCTVVDGLVEALQAHGVRRVFGIPGGGSSLALIDSLDRHGIPFILAQTETAAVLMAAVTAEISGAPGVALTGVGPGAASAVNGIAYASLERAPLLLVTDAVEDDADGRRLHQRFDQNAVFAPLCKRVARLDGTWDRVGLEDLITGALALPAGPVQIDLGAVDASNPLAGPGTSRSRASSPAIDEAEVDAARSLLLEAERPAVIAGLYARDAAASAALKSLVAALGAPVLTTYKAKGAVPDDDPHLIGHFTGAAAEADCLNIADLILLYGFDPIESIPRPWRYVAPILEFSPVAGLRLPADPAVRVIGPLDTIVAQTCAGLGPTGWLPGTMADLKAGMIERLRLPKADHHTVQTVVEAAQYRAPAGARLAVDAGAHMFSAMALWRAGQPHDVLKSNGLSTMGFALPAAIAAALEDPQRPVIALVGDGGMMMSLAELATASRLGCRIVVLVCNDAALSLIDIKQQQQARPSLGVRYPRIDLAAAAEALGCRGWTVGPKDDLDGVLSEAFAAEGPALVDVSVDPSGYSAQLRALRG